METSSSDALGEGGSDVDFHFGSPEHLQAARTVVAETWGRVTIPARIYRIMEFIANFCLIFVMMWVVWAAWIFIPLALFWYIPAAIRTGSATFSPILLFAADNFSLLQLHPTPTPAREIYIVAVARVFACLLVFPFFGAWSPRIHNNYLRLAWEVFALTLASITALWLFITIGMLIVTHVAKELRIAKSLRGELDHQLLDEVRSLGEEIHKVSSLPDPSMCKRGLQELHQRRPEFPILGFVGAWMPLFFTILHLCLDVGVAITFATTPTRLGRIMAFVLGSSVVCTLVMMLIRTHWRLWRVFYEAYLSQRRGLYTSDYLNIIRVDKGFEGIIALAVKIFQLPYSARSQLSLAVGMISIVSKVMSSASFIYQEFDLGTEVEGRFVDLCHKKQTIVATHGRVPGQHDQHPSYGSMAMLLDSRAPPIHSPTSGYGPAFPTEQMTETSFAPKRRCRYCDCVFYGDAMFCPRCGKQLRGTEYLLTAEAASTPPTGPVLPQFGPAPMPSEVLSARLRPGST